MQFHAPAILHALSHNSSLLHAELSWHSCHLPSHMQNTHMRMQATILHGAVYMAAGTIATCMPTAHDSDTCRSCGVAHVFLGPKPSHAGTTHWEIQGEQPLFPHSLAIQASTVTCPCGMKNGRTHLSLGLQNIESSANGLAWLRPARWNGLRSSGRC